MICGEGRCRPGYPVRTAERPGTRFLVSTLPSSPDNHIPLSCKVAVLSLFHAQIYYVMQKLLCKDPPDLRRPIIPDRSHQS